MPEEKNNNLPENEVTENNSETTKPITASLEKTTDVQQNNEDSAKTTNPTTVPAADETESTIAVPEIVPTAVNAAPAKEASNETTDLAAKEGEVQTEDAQTNTDTALDTKNTDTDEDGINEIDDSNAEDAEDTDTVKRHEIPVLDYETMSMENLVGELQRLIKNEKVQAIKKHADGIRDEFNLKFQEFIENKKEDFVAGGGNEIDFKYNSVTKRQFNEVYTEYKEKRNHHYKSLEKSHKDNLAHRLDLIEQLKALVSVEEDINTTYNNFKNIQASWKTAGPVPRAEYNNVWRTYQHHIEIFYDFLHLNRELRDLDFKHNLEEKTKIVERAESLAIEPDLNRAFRELQVLHKIWKEDIGPVGKAHREEIWGRFSTATKTIHERRQEYFKNIDSIHEENLVKKTEIIEEITTLSNNVSSNHGALQKQIKQLEALRESFFAAGKVPQKDNVKTWDAFKTAVRSFNRNKNAFYKNLKKDQDDNLTKKRALLEVAHSLKDSEEYEDATTEMKRIQNEWKQIGHVPRKYSDKIWKEFKAACNHYFDRLHALKNQANAEETENLDAKEVILEQLKAYTLSDKRDDNLAAIKKFISDWKVIGHVPFKKKNINQKFNKLIDGMFNTLDISRQESELLKYGNKIQRLKEDNNQERAIQNERSFIRKKIDESKNEIIQLENNLQFFSNASEDSPIVRDVIKKVESHKEALNSWKAKLKKLNILQNTLQKETEEEEVAKAVSEDADAVKD